MHNHLHPEKARISGLFFEKIKRKPVHPQHPAHARQIIDDIVDTWEKRTDPKTTLAQLNARYPHTEMKTAAYILSRPVDSFNYKSTKKCLQLIYHLAKNKKTDSKSLLAILTAILYDCNLNIGMHLCSDNNKKNIRRYLRVLKAIAKRTDISNAEMTDLFTQREIRKNGDERSLTYNIAAMKDIYTLRQYLGLLSIMKEQGKMDAHALWQTLEPPKGVHKNIGEFILENESKTADYILLLTSIIEQLPPEKIKKLLPAKLRVIRDSGLKESIYEIIKSHPPNQRIDECISALDSQRPLGIFMRLRQGLQVDEMTSGTLNKILHTLGHTLITSVTKEIESVLMPVPQLFATKDSSPELDERHAKILRRYSIGHLRALCQKGTSLQMALEILQAENIQLPAHLAAKLSSTKKFFAKNVTPTHHNETPPKITIGSGLT